VTVDHPGRETGPIQQHFGFDNDCRIVLLPLSELRLLDRLGGERLLRRLMRMMGSRTMRMVRGGTNTKSGTKQKPA
jgi:hypothetical protein